jgi:CelD/BcsL family acetyltransferase involved in cellulose biosynthesis
MTIQESIAEGLKIYDFLGGVEPFKTRWGTATHYIQRLRIGAPGVVGALAFASTAGVEMFKDWGRASLPPALLRIRRRWGDRAQARRARRLAANSGDEPR